MTSLRRQLLAWLLPLYLLTAGVAMWVSYLKYETSISSFMDAQMQSLAQSYTRPSAPALPESVRPLDGRQLEHDGSLIVQLWRMDGRLVSTSWAVPSLVLQPTTGFRTIEAAGQRWRVYTAPSSPIRVQVAQSGDFRRRVILDSAWKSVQPIAFLIPISAALLWLAVFLALRPVDRLVQAITRQDERNLAELPLTKVPRELLPLIASMNGLLARLRDAFASQRRFLQDAAHELRTPLTALKLRMEGLRRELGSSADEEVTRMEAGIQRLQRLVEQMLSLARQEAARSDGEVVTVILQEALKQSIGSLIPLAESRGIDLGFEAAERAEVRVDAHDLRSVFDNLLDNALRYTPAGGSVDVTLQRSGRGAVVELVDTGPGIPPALLDRVFDRFYRVLGTGTQGSGLGLAIARTAAERNGLHLELSNRSDRTGLVARVSFPRAS